MSDSTERLLGELGGKMDAMTASFKEWREDHNERHAAIDKILTAHAADINKAKGARSAVFVVASAIAGVVGMASAFAHGWLFKSEPGVYQKK